MRIELAKLILVGTRITYQATGDAVSCVQRTQYPASREPRLSYEVYCTRIGRMFVGIVYIQIRISQIGNGDDLVYINSKAIVQASFTSSSQDTLLCLMLMDLSRKIDFIWYHS